MFFTFEFKIPPANYCICHLYECNMHLEAYCFCRDAEKSTKYFVVWELEQESGLVV